jgi:hypothetical protein
MANVKFDWTGVSSELRAKVEPILTKIYHDPQNRADINAGYNTVTIRFADLGDNKERANVTGHKGINADDAVVTFNLKGLSLDHNGQPTFDYGKIEPKAFSEVAVHENIHLIYPDLTVDSYHSEAAIKAGYPSTDLAATVVSEFAFRTAVVADYKRIFGVLPEVEFNNYIRLIQKMQLDMSETRSIDWGAKSFEDIVREIDNSSSDLRKFLPSSSTSGTRDERVVPSSPYTDIDISADGSIKSEHYRADGTIEAISGNDTLGSTFSAAFDGLGKIASYVFNGGNGQKVYLNGDAIGATLGSSIGKAIGGGNFVKSVVASTLVGSLGQALGGLISSPTYSLINGQQVQTGQVSILANLASGKNTLDEAFGQAVSSFGKAVPVNLLNNVTGGVSSLLMGELANAIGLKGFAGGAFTTVGTTIKTPKPANDNRCVRLRSCG